MLKRFARPLFAILLVAVSMLGNTADHSAESFISALSERLQLALTEAKRNQRLGDSDYLDQLIDREILPHVQLEVLGKRIFKEHWKEVIEKDKKKQAIDAIVLSLKRTYRLALGTYDGQNIDIIDSKTQKAYSLVRIKIKSSGESDHTIDFAIREYDTEWKVFDFSVDGIVVSKTLNSAISRQIEKAGIEATIKSLNQGTGS